MSGVNVPQSAWSPDDPFAGHPGPVPAVAVTPDGRQIVTGGDDGTARLWDRTSGQLQTTLTGQPRPVTAVAVTPDGRQRLPSTEAAP
jgi:WD40 repeat protein